MKDPTTLTLKLYLKTKIKGGHLTSSTSLAKKAFDYGIREIRTRSSSEFLLSGEKQQAALMIATSTL